MTLFPPDETAAGWPDLIAELDRWAAAGRAAPLWWRDDDAVAPTAALDRLLALADRRPLTLAVIPQPAEPALAAHLPASVSVAQHGWRHHNHRAPGTKAAELGADRPLADIAAELAEGKARLAGLFAGFTPQLVPPWNRIDPPVAALLPALGYASLSVFGPAGMAPAGLAIWNAHLDPIAWKRDRSFIGTSRALSRLIGCLAERRSGVDPDQPIGLLTHHLVHPPELWVFLAELLRSTAGHPGLRWIGPPGFTTA